jgi:DNA transformation protein
MRNSPDFIAHVLELMQAVGRASARSMFGGHGLYVDGFFVAIVADDTLYLKTDETTRAAFVARELPPFCYTMKDRGVQTMAYRRAPEEALESIEAMREWLRPALGAALRSAAARPKRIAKPNANSAAKTAAKKTTAKTTTATKTTATKTTATKATAKRVTKKAPTSKVPAKKAVAKKTLAKPPARKAPRAKSR